ncbi:hypothetical protein LHK99_20770 [Klebsiella quasipneumoniae]|uniref:hypothetical protein n=1 Tax=Klebsiella quasipneumoniae TaxID=1463165 RepID=UPI001CF96A7F|nr:hypothetical protein [Klebsiella quasipneumoniae]MCB4713125.1 hypothetical protein [Klebsiella quasipneumoniae]
MKQISLSSECLFFRWLFLSIQAGIAITSIRLIVIRLGGDYGLYWFDTILIWYTGVGFFLWTFAQIIRADETNGVFNNIACLLLFVIAWPKIMWTLCCLIVKRLFDVDHQ